MRPWSICALLSSGTFVCAHAAEPTTAKLPQIESDAVDEASGLAVSPKDGNFLWVINDSGGTTDLHLMGLKGEDRGKVRVEGVQNRDWEDLSSFTLDGTGYLLIADTGDNQSKHDSSTLLILKEPPLPEAGKSLESSASVMRSIQFQFEGGATDCESVAVDAAGGNILLLSKRSRPPVVYELPLAPSAAGLQIAKRIGTMEVESPVGASIPFSNQPTALDISPDRSKAAVVTYYGAFIFSRAKDERWSEAFARKPLALGPHGLPQAESIAFSSDGSSLLVVSEGKHSLIRSFPLKADK